MGEELKPCPFCGGEPEEFRVTDEKTQPLVGGHPLTVRTGNAFFGVRCPRCDVAQTNPFINRDYAVEAWNKRPDPAATMKEVVEVLRDCAEDLESMVEAHYGGGIKDHPAMKPKYERDMEPAERARAILAKLEGK